MKHKVLVLMTAAVTGMLVLTACTSSENVSTQSPSSQNTTKQQNNKTTKQQDHKTLFHHLHTPPSIRKNEDVNTLLQGFEPPSIG